MNKTDYIIRQIAKSYKKKYENYVITRIWHLLNNTDIKFVTQQHVTRPNGRALTDMYFPQIQLHLEILESHHFVKDGSKVDHDFIREADIINATGHILKEVSIFSKSLDGKNCVENSLENINQQIDEVVDFIKSKINSTNILPWDLEAEYNPQTYIDKGFISVQDNVAFLTTADACNCFGHNYISWQRGRAKHPHEDKGIWFPKLYDNKVWDNEISFEEDRIYEKKKVGHKEYFEITKNTADSLKERIVFAHAKNNLGITMYRFKGVYKFNLEESETNGRCVYIRAVEDVKTYKPK